MANEAATAKDAQFVLISILPDVCLTPDPKGVPVPYVITHKMDQSKQCSPNVYFRDKPAYLHNESYVDNVKGDELGAGVHRGQHHHVAALGIDLLARTQRLVDDQRARGLARGG